MNREYINDIAAKIELDPELVDCVNQFLDVRSVIVDSLARQISSDVSIARMKMLIREMKKYEDNGYILALCVVLAITEKTWEKYQKLGIGEDVFIDTMRDIPIWCENCKLKYGVNGLENVLWIANHLAANIFRLGRLQFQMVKVVLPPFIKFRARRRSPVKFGDNAIYIHIPQGDKLTEEACDLSMEKAHDFFRQYFPKYKYEYFICESWLLYPENRNFMAPESNIICFADRFEILGSSFLSLQGYERIWGKKCLSVDDYEENTTLQKNAKIYIKNGGRLGTAFGIIKK